MLHGDLPAMGADLVTGLDGIFALLHHGPVINGSACGIVLLPLGGTALLAMGALLSLGPSVALRSAVALSLGSSVALSLEALSSVAIRVSASVATGAAYKSKGLLHRSEGNNVDNNSIAIAALHTRAAVSYRAICLTEVNHVEMEVCQVASKSPNRIKASQCCYKTN